MGTILRMLAEREENKGVELTGSGAKVRRPRTRATVSAGMQCRKGEKSKAPHAKPAYGAPASRMGPGLLVFCWLDSVYRYVLMIQKPVSV